MAAQYRCKNQERLRRLRSAPALNGIDFLEVSDDQTTLQLHFVHPLPEPSPLGRENVAILGGVRVQGGRVLALGPELETQIQAGDLRVQSVSASGRVLVVVVNMPGDFSTYTLRLVNAATDLRAPAGFDPQLSELDFTFKVDCPSDFDCAPLDDCPPEALPEPEIDYLAKDYASFRRLLLDRLSVLMPDWKERNPADLQVMLVELLAYAGDQLSYYQDAVATEAYLGTAQRRVSVRRHARLMDYTLHEGCTARAWVCLWVNDPPGGGSPLVIQTGDQFLTRGVVETPAVLDVQVDGLLRAEAAEVFEALHDLHPAASRNTIFFYTWGDRDCCLPAGATHATLQRTPGLELAAGDVLVFEERISPSSGQEGDADPSHRQAVRLIAVDNTVSDPLYGRDLIEIEWHAGDALQFPLCISAQSADDTALENVSVAYGNVVLVDHGLRRRNEPLPAVGASRYRPWLQEAPVSMQGMMALADGTLAPFDPQASASAALRWDARQAQPWACLTEGARVVRTVSDGDWQPVLSLLNSGRFSAEFVVEVEDDGAARLRFGDDVLGMRPQAGQSLFATYRTGNGSAGNVGARAISRLVLGDGGLLGRVQKVWNAMPASGGQEPEQTEEAVQYAPQAFRTQQRAVTPADYIEIARRRPDVQNAAASLRWTGSWYTAFVTVDRAGGRPVDGRFENDLLAYLERFRLAGYDLEIDAPVFVPLDILLRVCVKPGYFRSNVRQALLKAFGSRELPGGQRGFFHADNFTFGKPLYTSHVFAAAMAVEGVESLEITRFQRWGKSANQELDNGVLSPGRAEVLRLDNDPNFPENGKIEFEMHGGL